MIVELTRIRKGLTLHINIYTRKSELYVYTLGAESISLPAYLA